jgi:hypothetical protein
MKTETTNQESQNPVSAEKKVYHTPGVRSYGSLAELVQFQPGRGGDGEVVFIDCTLT